MRHPVIHWCEKYLYILKTVYSKSYFYLGQSRLLYRWSPLLPPHFFPQKALLFSRQTKYFSVQTNMGFYCGEWTNRGSLVQCLKCQTPPSLPDVRHQLPGKSPRWCRCIWHDGHWSCLVTDLLPYWPLSINTPPLQPKVDQIGCKVAKFARFSYLFSNRFMKPWCQESTHHFDELTRTLQNLQLHQKLNTDSILNMLR